MRKSGYLLAALLAVSTTALAVDDRTVAGAVVGGVAGAVIGNEIGGKKGAAIGAAIGGVAGAAVGSGNVPPPPRPPMPGDIVHAEAGTPASRGEDAYEDEGERHRHHDNGHHYGERKHHHEEEDD